FRSSTRVRASWSVRVTGTAVFGMRGILSRQPPIATELQGRNTSCSSPLGLLTVEGPLGRLGLSKPRAGRGPSWPMANARLTEFGRLLLVQRITELGWPQAAESLGCRGPRPTSG